MAHDQIATQLYVLRWSYGRSGARFSKVPIIKGPVKLFWFTCKIEVSIVLHLT